MTGAAPATPGVVLLHGLARTRRSLRPMERALQRAGFATLNLGYQSRSQSLDELAEAVYPAIDAFAGQVGALHVVTHSMGGVVARLCFTRHRPGRLQRMVMLAPPNGGSEVADLLKDFRLYRAFYGPAGQQLGTAENGFLAALPPPDYAVGIIAGNRTLDPVASRFILPRPNDGRVSVASTRLAGMADHVVVSASHSGVLLHREAIGQTIAFLRDGRFAAEPARPALSRAARPSAGAAG